MKNGHDKKGIQRRDGSGLDGRRKAAEQRHRSHDRHQEFPFRAPQRLQGFFRIERMRRIRLLLPLTHSPKRRGRHHDESRNDSPEKHFVDGHFSHDGVNNHWETGRQQ